MLYSKSEFCRRAGITAEAFRYYTDLKIIKPKEILENGYRKFSREDILTVWGILLGKSMGRDVKSYQIPKDSSLEGYYNLLDKRESDIDYEINKLIIEKESIKVIKNCVIEEINRKSNITIEDGVDGYRVAYDGSSSSKEAVSKLVRKFPYSYTEITYPLVSNKHDYKLGEPKIGLGILDRWVREFDIDVSKGFLPMKKSKCICMPIITNTPFELNISDFKPILDEINKNEYKICSDIICNLFSELNKDNEVKYFLKCRVLIKE